VLLFVSIVLILFQYKPVQTWAARKATNYLSKELHTRVDIKSIYIKPFSSVVLEDLLVLDKQQDTLLRTPLLTVELSNFSIFNSIKKRDIEFKSIQLDNGAFYLKKLKDSTTNLSFIIDYFNGKPDTVKKVSKPWMLNFGRIAVNNFHFRYKNFLKPAPTPGLVNFDNLDVSHFSTVLTGMDLKNHLFKGHLQNLTLQEKSGFVVKNLTVNANIDTNQILLQNLSIITPNSHLKDYFRMRFKSFDDFSDFENKVMMDADLKDSHLSSTDIKYFTPSLAKASFDFGINGRATGLVNNIKARNLTVTTGQATYIKGNFSLKGLPNWEKTTLLLQFDQLATNKKDLDNLYSRFTGTPNQHLPAELAKFGNISFSGKLSGTQNNFNTKGTFKTLLGRLDPDINLKFSAKGIPAYNGKLGITNFDLAKLLDNKTLGRTTLTAKVNGSGNALNNLNTTLNAKVKYIDFKGYQYQNLDVDGSFKNKVAKAKIKIADRNLKLNLNGNINLNPTLPQYEFTAVVRDARLNKLKLVKDTLSISTNLNTKFSGNNLNNLQGFVSLMPTRIITPKYNYVVDSLMLAANGIGSNRTISLKSDLADGNIKGSYDLTTLPSYYKTIAKKYIPSLKTTIFKPGPQNFAFRLDLKNVDPLLLIFMPQLKIPDRGTLVGRFNSADKTATLSGLIKTVKYEKMVFHDFIIDESTADSLLTLNLSLSRVDLTDSLYIKDINITNFLRNDSLNFNVKLSDKNATNQLDLYGLVEFGRDTTAKLKLLPSEVILERQSWRLTEQVRIRILNGKTKIENFELTNGQQEVRINGLVSNDIKDVLTVQFERFSMATINQLTKAAGVSLGGYLNGDVKVTSVLKNQGVDANLRVDSLMMNKTLVGDVKILSDLDNERKRANVKLNILNRGLETLNIAGAYYLNKDEGDKLDFDVRMDQTEAVIFAPFIRNLVSDVTGTLSADLKLTGKPSNPQLNGDITLTNTGITVDYLKVPYTINDKVKVTNSVIVIDGMIISDAHGGKATANGKVDLTDFATPLLDIHVTANNLMALNTTLRDNRIYYGTAYGSGTFSFTGPIDNMKIDIKAKTEEGTVFNIPLNTSATAGDYEFIRFVSHKDSTNIISNNANRFKGVTLNFDLSADEKTAVKITTDLGVLEGRGTANGLKLNINSLGDFEMRGDFLISSGKFEFTAKNFISKNFQVTQGGTLRWTGSPSNAEINLRAIYELRANIGDLYQAAGLQSPQGNRQELVQAQLILTRTLLQPAIDFDFSFPLNASVKDDMVTYLADVNNRSQQALSLIVRRQFAPGTGSNIDRQVLSTAKNAASEFLFNKINSYIAQSNFKAVDINFRSQSDASIGLRLLKERLLVSGSFYNANGNTDLFSIGSSNLFNSNFNSLTKDFNIEYLIRKDGQLRGRYSYRALNTATLSSTLDAQYTPQYVNGLGLIYQRDFDSFHEFIRNLFHRGRDTSNRSRRPGGSSIPVVFDDPEEDKE
jgi:hypothetical protein